jgi:hypothetical protein
MRINLPEPIKIGPSEMPIPNGIDLLTGDLLPPISTEGLFSIADDHDTVQNRATNAEVSFIVDAESDPNNLEQAGWGVIFPTDIDSSVKKALEPLTEMRQSQAGELFKVFEYQPGETVRDWLERYGVGLFTVNPRAGVPYYLLIVGSPTQIPLEFQYLLDAYWAVGRLHFATEEEYRQYAESVVEYESSKTVPQAKRVAIFAPRNDGDRATGLFYSQVALPLTLATPSTNPVGQRQGFKARIALGEFATKETLQSLLRGKNSESQVALLFTGSHGGYVPMEDPDQMEKLGAIVCQDWPGYGPPSAEHYVSAADLDKEANLCGMIHYLFACYGGGCPRLDTYTRNADGSPRQIATNTILARLPQKMLSKGCLAVIAHVDRAFAYSFQSGNSSPQIQDIRNILVQIMQGQRLGQAMDSFNLRWAVLSAELTEALRSRRERAVSDSELAHRWIARDDARNYLILGDPAVRLRVDVMAPGY